MIMLSFIFADVEPDCILAFVSCLFEYLCKISFIVFTRYS